MGRLLVHGASLSAWGGLSPARALSPDTVAYPLFEARMPAARRPVGLTCGWCHCGPRAPPPLAARRRPPCSTGWRRSLRLAAGERKERGAQGRDSVAERLQHS
eukprot:334047-Chlamydomonas_euryale.AAC.1